MSLDNIFRAYDIRGKVPADLDADVMERIGRAFGTHIGQDAVVLGHDVRESSPALRDAFAAGATATGTDVLDTGHVPYGPVLAAGRRRELPTAYVTASHLDRGWNGIKFSDAAGRGYPEDANMAVKELFDTDAFDVGDGDRRGIDTVDRYRDRLLRRVDIDELDVLMDCGNGSSAVVAPDLFWQAGATLEVMNGEPDGTFPNRTSDVTPDALRPMRELMADGRHDVGIAYDGDADRVGVVDDTGRLLSAERVAAVLLGRLLPDRDGPIVANVECSRILEDIAEAQGREVVRVRVGHSYLFEAAMEHGAVLAVEKSRHMAVPHVSPLNDGIAASVAVAAAVSRIDGSLADEIDALPLYEQDRFGFEVPDPAKFDVVDDLTEALAAEYDETNTTDGIRIDLDEGWVLIRASNTSPKIRLTVEAETRAAFDELKEEFSRRLQDAIDRHT